MICKGTISMVQSGAFNCLWLLLMKIVRMVMLTMLFWWNYESWQLLWHRHGICHKWHKCKMRKIFLGLGKIFKIFSGKIDIFWNLTGVKDLTNSKSVVTFPHARVTVSPIGKSSTSRKSFSLSSYLERRVGGGGPSLQFQWKIPKIPTMKKSRKIPKIPKTGGRARSFPDASTWGAPSVEIIGEASKN